MPAGTSSSPATRPTFSKSVGRLGHGRGQPDRPRVRGRGGECAQPDDEPGVELLGETDHEPQELEPVEVRLGTDQEEQVEAPRVRAVAKLDLGPAQRGRHAVDDAGHRPSGALVQEVLAVEGGDQVGVGDLEQCRDRGRGAEARIDPSFEGDDEDGVGERRLVDQDHPVIGRRHVSDPSRERADSASAVTWAGNESTDPVSPAVAPAT